MIRKLIQIGSSAGVTIPKDTLTELGANVGDEVDVHVNRKVGVSADDIEVAKMTANFIKRYRKDLEALAKL